MKKLALTLCIAGSSIALAACSSYGTGNVDTAAPYEMERTASHQQTYTPAVAAEPVRAERTFKRMQSK